MIKGSRRSYDHRWKLVSPGSFQLSWTYDTRVQGSRLRFPRTCTRLTDRDGALRFAKRWGLQAPPEASCD